MNRRGVQALMVLVVGSTCLPALSAGIQSVGLHWVAPWARMVLSVGAEVVPGASRSDLSVSLSLLGGTDSANAFSRPISRPSCVNLSCSLPLLLFGVGTSALSEAWSLP